MTPRRRLPSNAGHLRERRRARPAGVVQAAAVAVIASTTAALAGDAAKPEEPPIDFVVGDYVVIGREPDGGLTYSGSARIRLGRDGLVLERSRGDHHVSAAGRMEVPSPPGEGQVLRFRWKDPEAVTETCLIGADLDNYARLTCYWVRDGTEPRQPGLEAMFPTADWPDTGAKR